MLDVHAPDHRILEKRDFFVHLFTITCGLLIALGLEQGAEAIHHRHQRKEAEAEIRQEIRLNLSLLDADQKYLSAEMKDMVGALNYTEARIGGGRPDASTLRLQLRESPMKDAAWRTASTTGVAQYMDYETAENYAECYKELSSVEFMQQRLLGSYLSIEGFVATKGPDALSTDELREALPSIREALSNLGGSRDLDTGMIHACQAALK